MNRVIAAAKALRGLLVVLRTAIDTVLGVLDVVTDVGSAVKNPDHKTLADRHVESQEKLKK